MLIVTEMGAALNRMMEQANYIYHHTSFTLLATDRRELSAGRLYLISIYHYAYPSYQNPSVGEVVTLCW